MKDISKRLIGLLIAIIFALILTLIDVSQKDIKYEYPYINIPANTGKL